MKAFVAARILTKKIKEFILSNFAAEKLYKKVLKTGVSLLKNEVFLLKNGAFLLKNTKKYAFFSRPSYLIVTTQPPKPDSQPKIHEICG